MYMRVMNGTHEEAAEECVVAALHIIFVKAMATFRSNLNSVSSTYNHSLSALRKRLTTCFQKGRQHSREQQEPHKQRFEYFHNCFYNRQEYAIFEQLKRFFGKRHQQQQQQRGTKCKSQGKGEKVHIVAKLLSSTLIATAATTATTSTAAATTTTTTTTTTALQCNTMTVLENTFMAVRDEHPDIDNEVRAILTANAQTGATISQIKADYRKQTGVAFPLYGNITDFLLTIPRVTAECTEQGTPIFNIKPSSKSKHIYDMVTQQKRTYDLHADPIHASHTAPPCQMAAAALAAATSTSAPTVKDYVRSMRRYSLRDQYAMRRDCHVYTNNNNNNNNLEYFNQPNCNSNRNNYNKNHNKFNNNNLNGVLSVALAAQLQQQQLQHQLPAPQLASQPIVATATQHQQQLLPQHDAQLLAVNSEHNLCYKDNWHYLNNRFNSVAVDGCNAVMSQSQSQQQQQQQSLNNLNTIGHNKRHYPLPSSSPTPTPMLQHSGSNAHSDSSNTLNSEYDAHLLDFPLLGDDFFLYMARMELKCKFKQFERVLQSGFCVSGQTINDAIKRVKHLAMQGNAVIVNIGSVDIMHGRPLVQIEHDFRQLINELHLKNMKVVLTTLAPLANYAHDPPTKTKLLRFNEFIKREGTFHTVVDIHSCLVNEHGTLRFDCYQNAPRSVTGTREPHVFWNKIGRQRVLQMIEAKLEY